MNFKILVVGATGATGMHVVKQLLDHGQSVRVVVRNKQRMLDLVKDNNLEKLEITEASLLDLSDDQLRDQVKDVKTVVSCLGHNMDFKGIFGHPRKLVTQAAQRLTAALEHGNNSVTPNFILMGSDGVAHPDGSDPKRSLGERMLLTIFHYILPPMSDNEAAADFIYNLDKTKIEWTIVRPTDLVNGDATEYELHDAPLGLLFNDGKATRATVAKFMTDLIVNDKLWEQYKYKMPVLYDKGSRDKSGDKKEL